MSPPDTDFERATGFLERVQRDLCTYAEPWRWGVHFGDRDLHRIWDLNLLYLSDPPATVHARDLAAEAEDLMGAFGNEHRRVLITDEALGAQLAPGFEELGWETDIHVVMAHRRDPDRSVDTSMVEELGAAIWPSREKQLRSYPWADDDETAEQ